jgi:hypothetical protein
MFGGYKEKDVMKIRTDLIKRPVVAFDKDTNIKALAATGEYKLFVIDKERGEFLEKSSRVIFND